MITSNAPSRNLLPPVLLLLVVAVMWLTHAVLPFPPVLPASTRWLGALSLAIGVVMAVAARAQFARAATEINTFAEPTRLVTGGLFRWSRNPMYLGMGLAAAGMAALSGAATSLLLAAVFVAIVDRWYIAFEERRLRARFGAAYETYARSTRRWV
ncbi:isoprenylcysteine carboxylmethyltransferase family protein [Sorangium sp. So ce295]|jgi:protein-S-isoprenylcysteine O-methyltransferase Ste14|uniref:methyltransferase family protein n=1 Tax=Sorangium sp. So ce295 TaxID=3133295 RepID=UPI003F5DF0D6